VEKLKILHTGDVHFGAKLAWLGARGQEQRRKTLETFGKIIDLAINARIDLLLIAGDLFDSARPSRELIQAVQQGVERLARYGIQVCLLPGTHDRYDGGSIYRGSALAAPNLHIFREERLGALELNELEVTVYGNAAVLGPGEDLLAGLARQGASRWHICLAHGSLPLRGMAEQGDPVIEPASIERSGMDYVALGHWHSMMDYSQGGVPAYYCGAPEPVSPRDREAGFVILVELGAGGKAEIKPVRVSRRRLENLEIHLEEVTDAWDLKRRIQAHGDDNLIAQVVLRGLVPEGMAIDLAELHDELAPFFFHLDIRDETLLSLDQLDSGSYPENTLIGRFVRVAEEMLEHAEGDRRRLVEEAARAGLAFLRKDDATC
jgi:DNA repair exonuclease SbcCD nuclease subunit